MRTWAIAVALVLVWSGGVLSSAVAATPEQVEQAIQRARAFLYEQQQADGTWESRPAPDPEGKTWSTSSGQWGGTTAVVTYALLASGESPQSPKLQKAIEFLKKAELTGVYALGMRMQVWTFLPPTAEVKQLVRRDATLLMTPMHQKGEFKGLYDYVQGQWNYSLSRSQYGVLGMWAAAQMGLEVPKDYWQTVESAWLKLQSPQGAWRYIERDDMPYTPGITAVGVATLFITQDYLHAGRGISCNGNVTNPAIEKGLKWMADNFDKVATDQRYGRDYPYFTLYSVERIGVASGLKAFGGVDWFSKGAGWLVKKQAEDGSWDADHGPISNTSMALLFLSRGRAPIAINKLRYEIDGKEGHWNQRPREVANVTRWIGRSLERELNWQIVNLDMSLKDLHEAPILYIGGSQDLKFSEERMDKLRQFIEGGGLVLASADCSARAFANSFRRLGSDLFPSYEFRELPVDHALYTKQQFPRANWRSKPSVLGLSNGARELMILLPQMDAAKTWQLQILAGRDQDWQLPANILMYATDRQPMRTRGEHYLVERDPKIKTGQAMKLVRLKYSSNWDPEPGGWRRMANILFNQHKVDLAVETSEIESLGDAKIAHLTGTANFNFSNMQQMALRKFIDDGGTLIVDVTGGSTEFAKAAETLINQLFPGQLKPLPTDHPLSSVEVSYRSFAQQSIGTSKYPRLQGVVHNDRTAIIYSREDLSAGLVGQPVDGIIGYTPESASALMSQILLYASGRL